MPLLSVGGIGVISVLSNVLPNFVHNMVNDFLSGNIEKAKNAQLDALPLIDALFCEVNPIPVKEALNMMGYNFGIPRLPLVELSENGKEKLRCEMAKFGLIK